MKRQSLIAVTGLSALILAGCGTDLSDSNKHTLILEIAGITPSVLYSDVDGQPIDNDDVSVTVNLFRKNPTVSSTSALEHVTLRRYEVVFFRTDGRNVQGVDVPYTITGPLNARLHTPTDTGEIQVVVGITVVRHQAKLEPPLRNLAGIVLVPKPPLGSTILSGAGVLTTIARITVHGETLEGEGLQASAEVQVTFADFGD
jgi:hypothetical protein